MSSALYRLINPPVKRLLRSPLHGLMSRNTLLLEFTGRKSGRALSTPISYRQDGGAAHCFTNRSFGWWRNLSDGQEVQLTVRGGQLKSRPLVVTDDHDLMSAELTAFLKAVPRDASHAGVSMDSKGDPDPDDVRRVVPGMVYLRFPVERNDE